MQRPSHVGLFQFSVLAGLRAAQLTRGCTPRIAAGHKTAVTAQMEIAAGFISAVPAEPVTDVLP